MGVGVFSIFITITSITKQLCC